MTTSSSKFRQALVPWKIFGNIASWLQQEFLQLCSRQDGTQTPTLPTNLDGSGVREGRLIPFYRESNPSSISSHYCSRKVLIRWSAISSTHEVPFVQHPFVQQLFRALNLLSHSTVYGIISNLPNKQATVPCNTRVFWTSYKLYIWL